MFGIANQLLGVTGLATAVATDPAQIATLEGFLFNAHLNAFVCAIFILLVSTVLVDSLRVWVGLIRATRTAALNETPFVPSAIAPERAWGD